MSEENVMNNVTGIELTQLTMDSSKPSNCIIIKTRRNIYCFRLSESFPIEKQYDIFRQFVIDVNTPLEIKTNEENTKEKLNEDEAEQKFNAEKDKGE